MCLGGDKPSAAEFVEKRAREGSWSVESHSRKVGLSESMES